MQCGPFLHFQDPNKQGYSVAEKQTSSHKDRDACSTSQEHCCRNCGSTIKVVSHDEGQVSPGGFPRLGTAAVWKSLGFVGLVIGDPHRHCFGSG